MKMAVFVTPNSRTVNHGNSITVYTQTFIFHLFLCVYLSQTAKPLCKMVFLITLGTETSFFPVPTLFAASPLPFISGVTPYRWTQMSGFCLSRQITLGLWGFFFFLNCAQQTKITESMYFHFNWPINVTEHSLTCALSAPSSSPCSFPIWKHLLVHRRAAPSACHVLASSQYCTPFQPATPKNHFHHKWCAC